MNVEEAKNHQCPLCISFTEQGLSKSGLKITDYVYANCIADRCMAWRWHEEFVTDHLCETFLNEDSRLEYKPRPVLSKTSGYCGVAGKEGAE